MEFSVPIFIIVLVLGILQLAVGVAVGQWLSTRRSKPPPGDRGRAQKLRRFAGRLHQLVVSVASEVGQHRSAIREVNRELASAGPEEGAGLSEVVLRTVAQIVQINERLQDRLDTAEQKLQQQTEQIESHLIQARTDPLTGLPNRRAFDDELLRRVAEWKRKNVTFCLTMIDIDHFKRLNDGYGHPAGDHALREIADLLGRMIREMDMAARIGGEEFAVILPSTNSSDAKRTAERIRAAIASTPLSFEQAELALTVSLGVAAVRIDDDPFSLVKRADEALYAAKRAGRNCGFFHDSRECRRIGRGTRSPLESTATDEDRSRPAGADPGDAVEMTAICGQLRDRLSELADEPTPLSSGDGGRA